VTAIYVTVNYYGKMPRFSRTRVDLDAVFVIVHSCWTGGAPS
jgi:hypothetical protein